MNPGVQMLLFVGLGAAMAAGSELFIQKVAFAKNHGTLTTALGFLAFITASLIASLITHDGMMFMVIGMGYFLVYKIKEHFQKRNKERDQCAEIQAQIATALSRRKGNEAVEFDISKAPETVRWTLINSRMKQGFTVETVKNLSTGSLKLRISGRMSRAE
jgi:hypothetical protein